MRHPFCVCAASISSKCSFCLQQSAAVPAERAVLKALLSMLRKVFVPKIRT